MEGVVWGIDVGTMDRWLIRRIRRSRQLDRARVNLYEPQFYLWSAEIKTFAGRSSLSRVVKTSRKKPEAS